MIPMTITTLTKEKAMLWQVIAADRKILGNYLRRSTALQLLEILQVDEGRRGANACTIQPMPA
jgi:hypothetical protein